MRLKKGNGGGRKAIHLFLKEGRSCKAIIPRKKNKPKGKGKKAAFPPKGKRGEGYTIDLRKKSWAREKG